jgi:hypothetical protein
VAANFESYVNYIKECKTPADAQVYHCLYACATVLTQAWNRSLPTL